MQIRNPVRFPLRRLKSQPLARAIGVGVVVGKARADGELPAKAHAMRVAGINVIDVLHDHPDLDEEVDALLSTGIGQLQYECAHHLERKDGRKMLVITV